MLKTAETCFVCSYATGSTAQTNSVRIIVDQAQSENRWRNVLLTSGANKVRTKYDRLSGEKVTEAAPRWGADTDMRAFLILASLLSICSIAFSQSSSPDCRSEFVENIDFPGSDIKYVYAADATHCQHLCTHHPSCLFFTFLRRDWIRDRRWAKLGEVARTEAFTSQCTSRLSLVVMFFKKILSALFLLALADGWVQPGCLCLYLKYDAFFSTKYLRFYFCFSPLSFKRKGWH